MAPLDPLHTCIALGPVATYLLVLGSINLSSRPLLTTGARDAAALAIATAGLVVAGPLELFLSERAAVFWGGWVWLIMLAAYALAALLFILMLRPRLVIYNITVEQLRPVMADVVAQLDGEARWAGESLVMPQLGVQLHVDALPVMKNVQLVASGMNQNLDGWRQLETALAKALRKTRSTPNPYGVSLVSFGLLLAGLVTYSLARDPGAVMQALNDMLRR
jgi:hypothetical protein